MSDSDEVNSQSAETLLKHIARLETRIHSTRAALSDLMIAMTVVVDPDKLDPAVLKGYRNAMLQAIDHFKEGITGEQ